MTKERQVVYVETRAEWRQWLEENHSSKQSVLLLCNTKKSNLPTINWSELVDEALCFGWIDSTRKSIDETKFTQLFTRRKPRGTWSKINKEKIKISKKLTKKRNNKFSPKDNFCWEKISAKNYLFKPRILLKCLQSKIIINFFLDEMVFFLR